MYKRFICVLLVLLIVFSFFSQVTFAGEINLNYVKLDYPNYFFFWEKTNLPGIPYGKSDEFAKELGSWCSIPEKDMEFLKRALDLYLPVIYGSETVVAENQTVYEAMKDLLFIDSMQDSIHMWEERFYNPILTSSYNDKLGSFSNNSYKSLIEILKQYYKYASDKSSEYLPMEWISTLTGIDDFITKASGNKSTVEYLNDSLKFLKNIEQGKSFKESIYSVTGLVSSPKEIINNLEKLVIGELRNDMRYYIRNNISNGNDLLNISDIATSGTSLLITAAKCNSLAAVALATIDLQNKLIENFEEQKTDADNYCLTIYDILQKSMADNNVLNIINITPLNTMLFDGSWNMTYDIYHNTYGDYVPYAIMAQNIFNYKLSTSLSPCVKSYVQSHSGIGAELYQAIHISKINADRLAISKNIQVINDIKSIDVINAKSKVTDYVKKLYKYYNRPFAQNLAQTMIIESMSETYCALNVSSTNGTVMKSPEPADAVSLYLENTKVTLTAVPAAGYTFINWSGDITSTQATITVTMDSSKSIMANFKKENVSISMETQDIANKLSKLGVFMGSDKGFELDREPTRLEGLIILIRLLGAEKKALAMNDKECKFTDVPSWGKGYINYAYENKLTTGISESLFGSNEKMDANSYITFLLRALGYDDKAGDFKWSKAAGFAWDMRLIDARLAMEIAAGEKFTRGHVAKYSYDALKFLMKGSESTLVEHLVNNGAISEDNVKQAGLIEYVKNRNYDGSINIGQYIQFGEYLGEPILWRVINKDSEGNPMLFSEKIISFKSFDAAHSGTYKYNHRIDGFGSGNWEISNISEWLNSSEVNVQYSTQPPVTEALAYTKGYADEKGFLSSFTENEIARIKEVNHKMLLSEIDKDQKEGGEMIHKSAEVPSSQSDGNPQEALTNYDKAYYKMITDKVFLLSVKELKEYVFERDWEWIKESSETAMTQVNEESIQMDSYNFYWLRTPGSEGMVRKVGSYNETGNGYGVSYLPAVCQSGICPAVYIDFKNVNIQSGIGSKDKPYILNFD